MNFYYDELSSPIGPLTVIMNGEVVVRIDFGTMEDIQGMIRTWCKRYFGEPIFIHQSEKLAHVKQEMKEYFAGTRYDFTFEYTFYGTPFQQAVWEALMREIPYGATKTYKDIAQAIHNERAVRAVGGAVNKNPFSIVVPCHRVIGMNGKMVGYGGGIDKKEFLLRHELEESRSINES